MKAYKGFDKDLKCRDFQYEIGQTYETNLPPKACSFGFHACEAPLDTFRYYPPGTSRYCEVEQDGDMDKGVDDSKVASSKITICPEIGIAGIAAAQVKYITAKCAETTEQAASGESGNAAASGWSGNAAASGVRGVACASGRYGSATASGEQTIAVAWGQDSRASGNIGSWILCAEYSEGGEIIAVKLALVDGETIKPDTWYSLKNGEFTEVDEE